ncbi:MAG: phosphonopyruvate decarboxylase [Elusimicrobiota bacterium]|jgi:phosphonopyruvate decarboxylase|nr:phosphonopyruvate decarboxylase [Elusimicrobiota bacterium]
MIDVSFFYSELKKNNVDFFCGVPDSLLKSFCAFITDNCGDKKHIVAVNEGAAIGLAAGYYLALGKIPLIYMQNSGIGNAINPLLSLADFDVYQIPMILLIGWRGEPGIKDEPQHVKQGKVTCDILKTLGIPYSIVENNEDDVKKQMAQCFDYFSKNSAPYAFVVRKDIFKPYVLQNKGYDNKAQMSREEAIEDIVNLSNENEAFISTTGMISRELYEIRDKYKMNHSHDFLTVGSMGHASHIALGAALEKPEIRFTCLDGDGAVLMHLGSLCAIGTKKPFNLRHIVLNNGAHDSVGGQPTIAPFIDICQIARAAGYEKVYSVSNKDEMKKVLAQTRENCGLIFIEIIVRKGARKDLGRPKMSPVENKEAFMQFLKK